MTSSLNAIHVSNQDDILSVSVDGQIARQTQGLQETHIVFGKGKGAWSIYFSQNSDLGI